MAKRIVSYDKNELPIVPSNFQSQFCEMKFSFYSGFKAGSTAIHPIFILRCRIYTDDKKILNATLKLAIMPMAAQKTSRCITCLKGLKKLQFFLTKKHFTFVLSVTMILLHDICWKIFHERTQNDEEFGYFRSRRNSLRRYNGYSDKSNVPPK